MAWTLAPALQQLRNELNARWPNRDKSSDGAIGDTAHAATWSDHNPNAQGVVCAIDVDTDLDGTDDSNDPEMDALVEWIRTHPHPNLKYVIYRGRMFSSYAAHGYAPFEWRPYTKDPHISHPHVSVGEGPDGRSAPGTYNDTTPWLVGFVYGQAPAPEPIPVIVPQEKEDMFVFAHNGSQYAIIDGKLFVSGDDLAPGEKLPQVRDALFNKLVAEFGPVR